MKQGKLINRIMMLVLLAAVVVYLAASAWRSFRDPYTFVMSYAYTVDDSLEANELFLSRCTAFYGAGLYQADLATEQTRRAVNGWVEENTGGMIPEILTEVPAEDAALLRDYLRQSCIPGEQVELWNLWVSDIRVRAFRLTGPLADLDADALVQMAEREQTCITLTI